MSDSEKVKQSLHMLDNINKHLNDIINGNIIIKSPRVISDGDRFTMSLKNTYIRVKEDD